jgi:hypothetical protein
MASTSLTTEQMAQRIADLEANANPVPPGRATQVRLSDGDEARLEGGTKRQYRDLNLTSLPIYQAMKELESGDPGAIDKAKGLLEKGESRVIIAARRPPPPPPHQVFQDSEGAAPIPSPPRPARLGPQRPGLAPRCPTIAPL